MKQKNVEKKEKIVNLKRAMRNKLSGKRKGIILLIFSLVILSSIMTIGKTRNNQEILQTMKSFLYQEFHAPERKIAKTSSGEKICYLTFDDGPSENTIKILDVLKKYEVKATFFVIGNCLCEENRPILERIVAEGHTIGLHANNHKYEKFYADAISFLKDYESLYKTLKENYGIETSIFRLPGGSACKYLYGKGKEYVSQMHERGFACFDWNVTGEDSVGSPTVASIQKNVFERIFRFEKPIVLLHDSCIADATPEALPGIIEKVKEQGYNFDTLEEREEYVFPNQRK